MFNLSKKSLIFLGIISSIPMVYAQGDISSVFNETIQLFFNLIGDIFTTVLDALKSNPIYGKMFITSFIGIFFYSELKQIDVFKKNVKLAGFISVLIALIAAFGFPESVIGLLFSETTPFIGFVIAGFILLVAGNRSNWSHAAKGIAFIALMMSFGAIINLFPTWGQVIIAGFIIASLVSAIYNFTRLKTPSEKGEKRYKEVEEEEDIKKVIEDNPNVSDEDIAKYLTESTDKKVKPSDVKAVREEKPISKKPEEPSKSTKKVYFKPEINKVNELHISQAIKELDREGYLAREAKDKTNFTIQKLDRMYGQARKLWHELTHLPKGEFKKIGDITGEIWAKIMVNTTFADDYTREIINLDEGITKSMNELDKKFAFVRDKKFYKLTEDVIKKYKADILNLMEIIKKSNDFINSLQQKILRDASHTLYKDNEIDQKDIRDRLNNVLMCCEEQLRTIANKSNTYSEIIYRSNSLKTELSKLAPLVSKPIREEISEEGPLQRFRKWLGFKGSTIRGGNEKGESSRGEPIK